jgi:signal transduction histidine kinase
MQSVCSFSSFDLFFRIREVAVGTGLGLSFCYSIIKQHNGNIEILSTRKGTKVIVKLPTSKE